MVGAHRLNLDLIDSVSRLASMLEVHFEKPETKKKKARFGEQVIP